MNTAQKIKVSIKVTKSFMECFIFCAAETKNLVIFLRRYDTIKTCPSNFFEFS